MNRSAKSLVAPVVLWMSLFMILPMIAVVVVSFLSRDEYGKIVFQFQWGNYSRFFDSLYIGIYGETLTLAALTTVICLLLSYPLAYYVANLPAAKQKYWLILITVPFWVNFLIRTYAWVLLLRTQGVVNSLLIEFGWIDEPLQLLYTKGAVLLGMVYTFIPFMVLPIYVALERMDRKLIDAAYDLGATPRRAFWRITLPQTKSGVMTGSVLVFVTTMGMYVVTDILGGAKSPILSNIIQNQFMSARDWPFGAALSVVFMIGTIVLVGLFYRVFQTKYERGGRA